ncbi:MAG: sigma-70 family RNA polymerase sigma factor [Oscillospiraceae bacterium]
MVLDTGLRYDQLENLSDEELCSLSRAGQRQAEDVLATRYHWLVRSCARPYFLIGGDSEDLMQEGMFGLIKAMREFDPQRSPLFRPFAGLCIHQRRVFRAQARRQPEKRTAQSIRPLESLASERKSHLRTGRSRAVVDRQRKGCQSAGEYPQTVVRFRGKDFRVILDGLAYCEIAETVGRPIKSVDNAVQRIRRKVARQLSSGDISNS